jgi:hypothetical protein
MGIRQLESAAGVLALAGASLFIGIGHQYFVETLQGLIVAASVYVALEATRQSFLRTASLTAIVVALGLLVKITMLGFILPMVVYVSIAFIATRGRPRARTKPVDRLLAACALISIAAAAAWYERNGAEVVRDAFGSMVQDSALFYGSRGTLLSKLTYWVSNLSQCFSPFALLGIATVVLVLLACVVALWRLRKLPRRSWISTSVDDGSLMTAAMVGTVLAQILVFSLQINEETRFLMPIFPLFAPIVAWSLSRLKQTAITVVFLLAFALNGVAAHAFAHGYDPLRLATNTWLRQVHPDTGDADTLDKIVALTCGMTSPHGLSVIGVEYPELNQNSAQFYSAKHAPNRSAICQYGSLGYTETEVDRAWQRLFDRDVQQVVTLTAGSFSRQDAFNVTATAIGERLAASEQFALAEHVGERVLIYRRADTATNPAAQ